MENKNTTVFKPKRELSKMQKCSECGEVKLKVRTGKKYGDSYVYVDDKNKIWKGTKCCDCVTAAKQSYEPAHTELTHRKCRMCGDKLPQKRYFNCEKCVSATELSDLQYDDLIYYVNDVRWDE